MSGEADRKALEDIDRLAGWLDDRFRIPGTNVRFGLDPVLGLIPGVGDTASLIGSLYLVARAQTLGLPRRTIARMVLNIAIDWAIGAIPLLGDLFDIGYKANRKNVDLARRHVARKAGRDAAAR